MSWISWEYWCESCNHKWTEVSKRDEVTDTLPCKECAAEAKRIYSTVGMQFINMPQGGRNRFADVKEFESLKRARKESATVKDAQKIEHEIRTITSKK